MFLYINQRDGLSDTLLLRLLPEETSPKKEAPKKHTDVVLFQRKKTS